MEQEFIEEKVKEEKEITSLRREKKIVLSELTNLKDELATILNSINKNKVILEEQKEALDGMLNSISDTQLKWSQQFDAQKKEIEEEKKKLLVVEELKKEISEKENKILTEKEEVKELLKEKRQIVLDIKKENSVLVAKERAIEDKIAEFDKKVSKFEEDKVVFKNSLEKLINDFRDN